MFKWNWKINILMGIILFLCWLTLGAAAIYCGSSAFNPKGIALGVAGMMLVHLYAWCYHKFES